MYGPARLKNNMKTTIPVSVVMCVHNGEKYLKEAVDSILGQTFRGFEFIIINDGSTDKTADILADYEKTDNRVHVHTQENQGLIRARSLGYNLSKGAYIANMDADDISLPGRLREQFKYLEANRDVFVAGVYIEKIDESGKRIVEIKYPSSPGMVGWNMFFYNCLANPAVMIRRELIEMAKGYDLAMSHAEDFDLWARANFMVKLANIPVVLLKYRIHGDNISFVHTETQSENTVRIIQRSIGRLLDRDIASRTAENINGIAAGGIPNNSPEDIIVTAATMRQMYLSYVRKNRVGRDEKKEVLQDVLSKMYMMRIYASKISASAELIVIWEMFKLAPFRIFAVFCKSIPRKIKRLTKHLFLV